MRTGAEVLAQSNFDYLDGKTVGLIVNHTAPAAEDFLTRPQWLERLSGTPKLLEMLRSSATPEAIIASWQEEVAAFVQRSQPYHLYP